MKRMVIEKLIAWKWAITFLIVVALSFPIISLAVNSPTLISSCADRDCLSPAIVADSNGKVHVVWMDAIDGWFSSTTSIYHTYWNGEVWATPVAIATGSFSELPSLAADTGGNIHMTFDADINPLAWQVYYMKYNGTSWTSPVAISQYNTEGYDQAWDSEIAIDNTGNPHVAYTFMPGNMGNVKYTYYTKFNGSAWTTPVDLTQGGSYHTYPAIAADALGKIHVVWKSAPSMNEPFDMNHRVWNGSSWSNTVSASGLVSNGVQESQPRISIDKNNNAHMVWEESNYPVDSNFSIKYNKWTNATSSWGTPFLVSSVGYATIQGVPSVAVVSDTVNDVMVGWIDKSTSPFRLDFRKYNAGNSQWEVERKNEIQQTSADFPVAAIDKWDNIHIAWGEMDTTTNKYQVYYDAIPVATTIIGPSGGSLTTFNGDTLTFPNGALSSNQFISAQISPLSHSAPVNNWTVPRQYIFEPSNLTFNSPATAVFKYTDAEVTGTETSLGIYMWDMVAQNWVFKTGTVSRSKNTLTVQLSHFSAYGLFSTNDTVEFEKPFSENEENKIAANRILPIKFKFTDNSVNNGTTGIDLLDEKGAYLLSVPSSEIKYDEKKNSYSANISTKGLSAGFYQIKVMHGGILRDSLDFIISESGKDTITTSEVSTEAATLTSPVLPSTPQLEKTNQPVVTPPPSIKLN